jgi:hypothetical protein
MVVALLEVEFSLHQYNVDALNQAEGTLLDSSARAANDQKVTFSARV